MSKTHNREIKATVQPTSIVEMRAFCREASALIQRLYAEAYATAGVQAGDVRPITIQVRDRLLQERDGRWEVLVYIAAAAGGNPQNAQTVTVTTGTVLHTIVANQAYRILTDENGTIVMNVDVTGALSRWIETSVDGRIRESEEFAWT